MKYKVNICKATIFGAPLFLCCLLFCFLFRMPYTLVVQWNMFLSLCFFLSSIRLFHFEANSFWFSQMFAFFCALVFCLSFGNFYFSSHSPWFLSSKTTETENQTKNRFKIEIVNGATFVYDLCHKRTGLILSYSCMFGWCFCYGICSFCSILLFQHYSTRFSIHIFLLIHSPSFFINILFDAWLCFFSPFLSYFFRLYKEWIQTVSWPEHR